MSLPPALRRTCRGNMGTRCAIQGRELAISTDPSSRDDGAISFAELHSKCASKIQTSDPDNLSIEVVAGGNAGAQRPHQSRRQPASPEKTDVGTTTFLKPSPRRNRPGTRH